MKRQTKEKGDVAAAEAMFQEEHKQQAQSQLTLQAARLSGLQRAREDAAAAEAAFLAGIPGYMHSRSEGQEGWVGGGERGSSNVDNLRNGSSTTPHQPLPIDPTSPEHQLAATAKFSKEGRRLKELRAQSKQTAQAEVSQLVN